MNKNCKYCPYKTIVNCLEGYKKISNEFVEFINLEDIDEIQQARIIQEWNKFLTTKAKLKIYTKEI